MARSLQPTPDAETTEAGACASSRSGARARFHFARAAVDDHGVQEHAQRPYFLSGYARAMFNAWIPGWEKASIVATYLVVIAVVTVAVPDGAQPLVAGASTIVPFSLYDWRKRVHDPRYRD